MAEEPNLERTRQSDRVTKIGLRLGEEDVSRLWLFHFDMRLRTASVPMGGIGGVGTNDDYRKRGFAARIMNDSVAYMTEHDLDVGMLFGIQDFYERWGYITAMAGHEIRIDVADLPAGDAVVEAVGYESDVHRDAVLAMYAAGNTTRSCAAMRGSHYWTEFEKGTDWDEAPDGRVLLGADGASIAYLNMVGDPERTRVAEAFFATPPAMAAAAAYLARRAADAGHETVTLSCPPDDPFARYLRRAGSMHFEHARSSGGGMLRIIDDTHFEILRYTLIRPGNFRSNFIPRAATAARGLDEGRSGLVERKEYDFREYPAWEGRPPLEDLVIQQSQGAIPPRENEHLATSDVGVVMLRNMWRKSIDQVAGGKPA